MKTTSKIIMVLLLFISIIVYQFWYYLKEAYNIKVFYPGIALLMLGFTTVIWMETPKRTGFNYFMELFVLLTFSNLIDEAFFDPTKFQINEIIVSVLLLIRFIIIIWMLTTEKRYKRLRKK